MFKNFEKKISENIVSKIECSYNLRLKIDLSSKTSCCFIFLEYQDQKL